MTNEEAIGFLQSRVDLIDKYYPDVKNYREALVAAIEALGQQPCEDAISRAWLKEAIHNFYYGLKHTPTEEDIQAYIDAAPLVTPQPKMGRWIMSNDGLYRPICNNCGAHPWKGYIPTVTEATEVFKYCPNCGAKMGVEE